MRRVLVRDIDVRIGETESSCIIEYDDNDDIVRKLELSELELSRELESDT